MNGSTTGTRSAPKTTESAAAIASASTGLGAGLLTLVSAACCVNPVLAPLIVGLLGASGAVWAAKLKPYSLWILGVSLVFLLVGFWTVYRPRAICAVGGETQKRDRILSRIAKASLWVGSVSWTVALLLNLLLP